MFMGSFTGIGTGAVDLQDADAKYAYYRTE
jgi:hypothetical protein